MSERRKLKERSTSDTAILGSRGSLSLSPPTVESLRNDDSFQKRRNSPVPSIEITVGSPREASTHQQGPAVAVSPMSTLGSSRGPTPKNMIFSTENFGARGKQGIILTVPTPLTTKPGAAINKKRTSDPETNRTFPMSREEQLLRSCALEASVTNDLFTAHNEKTLNTSLQGLGNFSRFTVEFCEDFMSNYKFKNGEEVELPVVPASLKQHVKEWKCLQRRLKQYGFTSPTETLTDLELNFQTEEGDIQLTFPAECVARCLLEQLNISDEDHMVAVLKSIWHELSLEDHRQTYMGQLKDVNTVEEYEAWLQKHQFAVWNEPVLLQAAAHVLRMDIVLICGDAPHPLYIYRPFHGVHEAYSAERQLPNEEMSPTTPASVHSLPSLKSTLSVLSEDFLHNNTMFLGRLDSITYVPIEADAAHSHIAHLKASRYEEDPTASLDAVAEACNNYIHMVQQSFDRDASEASPKDLEEGGTINLEYDNDDTILLFEWLQRDMPSLPPKRRGRRPSFINLAHNSKTPTKLLPSLLGQYKEEHERIKEAMHASRLTYGIKRLITVYEDVVIRIRGDRNPSYSRGDISAPVMIEHVLTMTLMSGCILPSLSAYLCSIGETEGAMIIDMFSLTISQTLSRWATAYPTVAIRTAIGIGNEAIDILPVLKGALADLPVLATPPVTPENISDQYMEILSPRGADRHGVNSLFPNNSSAFQAILKTIIDPKRQLHRRDIMYYIGDTFVSSIAMLCYYGLHCNALEGVVHPCITDIDLPDLEEKTILYNLMSEVNTYLISELNEIFTLTPEYAWKSDVKHFYSDHCVRLLSTIQRINALAHDQDEAGKNAKEPAVSQEIPQGKIIEGAWPTYQKYRLVFESVIRSMRFIQGSSAEAFKAWEQLVSASLALSKETTDQELRTHGRLLPLLEDSIVQSVLFPDRYGEMYPLLKKLCSQAFALIGHTWGDFTKVQGMDLSTPLSEKYAKLWAYLQHLHCRHMHFRLWASAFGLPNDHDRPVSSSSSSASSTIEERIHHLVRSRWMHELNLSSADPSKSDKLASPELYAKVMKALRSEEVSNTTATMQTDDFVHCIREILQLDELEVFSRETFQTSELTLEKFSEVKAFSREGIFLCQDNDGKCQPGHADAWMQCWYVYALAVEAMYLRFADMSEAEQRSSDVAILDELLSCLSYTPPRMSNELRIVYRTLVHFAQSPGTEAVNMDLHSSLPRVVREQTVPSLSLHGLDDGVGSQPESSTKGIGGEESSDGDVPNPLSTTIMDSNCRVSLTFSSDISQQNELYESSITYEEAVSYVLSSMQWSYLFAVFEAHPHVDKVNGIGSSATIIDTHRSELVNDLMDAERRLSVFARPHLSPQGFLDSSFGEKWISDFAKAVEAAPTTVVCQFFRSLLFALKRLRDDGGNVTVPYWSDMADQEGEFIGDEIENLFNEVSLEDEGTDSSSAVPLYLKEAANGPSEEDTQHLHRSYTLLGAYKYFCTKQKMWYALFTKRHVFGLVCAVQLWVWGVQARVSQRGGLTLSIQIESEDHAEETSTPPAANSSMNAKEDCTSLLGRILQDLPSTYSHFAERCLQRALSVHPEPGLANLFALSSSQRQQLFVHFPMLADFLVEFFASQRLESDLKYSGTVIVWMFWRSLLLFLDQSLLSTALRVNSRFWRGSILTGMRKLWNGMCTAAENTMDTTFVYLLLAMCKQRLQTVESPQYNAAGLEYLKTLVDNRLKSPMGCTPKDSTAPDAIIRPVQRTLIMDPRRTVDASTHSGSGGMYGYENLIAVFEKTGMLLEEMKCNGMSHTMSYAAVWMQFLRLGLHLGRVMDTLLHNSRAISYEVVAEARFPYIVDMGMDVVLLTVMKELTEVLSTSVSTTSVDQEIFNNILVRSYQSGAAAILRTKTVDRTNTIRACSQTLAINEPAAMRSIAARYAYAADALVLSGQKSFDADDSETAITFNTHGTQLLAQEIGIDHRRVLSTWLMGKRYFMAKRTESVSLVGYGKVEQSNNYENFILKEMSLLSVESNVGNDAEEGFEKEEPTIRSLAKTKNGESRAIRINNKLSRNRSILSTILWLCWVPLFLIYELLISKVVHLGINTYRFILYILVQHWKPEIRDKDDLSSLLNRELELARLQSVVYTSIRQGFYTLFGVAYVGLVAGVIYVYWELPYWAIVPYLTSEKLSSFAFFIPTLLELAIFTFSLVFVAAPRAPPRTSEYKQLQRGSLQEVCLLIACHRSQEVIRRTLEHALQLQDSNGNYIFRPEQICIAHNGSQQDPIDRTGDVAADVSKEFNAFHGRKNDPETTMVQYNWVPVGNKSYAFYCAVKYHIRDKYKYVFIIDDDVMLPPDLFVPVHWFNDSVKAIAYCIRAANIEIPDRKRLKSKYNAVCGLQNLEYLRTGHVKYMHSRLGTALSAHGAGALWERQVLTEVLWRHNTTFHGEDLQMGFILHSLNKNYQMKVVASTPILTLVPDHLICKGLLWCKHDLKSVLIQRVRSWDAAAHRFLFSYLKLFFMRWSSDHWILKPHIVQEVWAIVNDYVRIVLLVIILQESPSEFAIFFGIYVAWNMLGILVYNYWTLRYRQDLRTPMKTILVYPIYAIALQFYRYCGFLYTVFHYLPTFRNAAQIKEWDLYADPPTKTWQTVRVHCKDELTLREANVFIRFTVATRISELFPQIRQRLQLTQTAELQLYLQMDESLDDQFLLSPHACVADYIDDERNSIIVKHSTAAPAFSEAVPMPKVINPWKQLMEFTKRSARVANMMTSNHRKSD